MEQMELKNLKEKESRFFDAISYDVDHPCRGRALIFNHNSFHSAYLAPRQGTELDEKYFVETLYCWGFEKKDIFIYQDLMVAGIDAKLKEMSSKDYSDCDMLICAFFSHGEQNRLYANDETFAPSLLWQYFSEERCPTLKGKPKLFFIQACRGSKLDEGVKVTESRRRAASESQTECNDQCCYDKKKEMLRKPTEDAKDGKRMKPPFTLNLPLESTTTTTTTTTTEFGMPPLAPLASPEDFSLTPTPTKSWSIKYFDEKLNDVVVVVDSERQMGHIQSVPIDWLLGRRKSCEDRSNFLNNSSSNNNNNTFFQKNEPQTKSTSTDSRVIDSHHFLNLPERAGRRGSLPSNFVPVPNEWFNRKKSSEQIDALPVEDTQTFIPPHNDPDVLVAYSTVQGFFSFRRPSQGSWFITVLRDVAVSYSGKENVNLLSLLTRVNCLIASDLESFVLDPSKKSFHKKKQISCFDSTLTKLIIFKNKPQKLNIESIPKRKFFF